jgi:hypothetical protein
MSEYGASVEWSDTDRGKLKNSEKNLSQCHFFGANLTQTAVGANLGLCSEKLATNHCAMAQPLHCSYIGHCPLSEVYLMYTTFHKLGSDLIVNGCHPGIFIFKIELRTFIVLIMYGNTRLVFKGLYVLYLPLPLIFKRMKFLSV